LATSYPRYRIAPQKADGPNHPRIHRNQENLDLCCQNSEVLPMIYALIGSENCKQLISELANTKDARWYRRLKIIDLSFQGKTVPQLAEMFDISSPTVRDYIHRYNSGGIVALRRGYSPGRPPKIDWTKEQWEELLHRSAAQFSKHSLPKLDPRVTRGLLPKISFS